MIFARSFLLAGLLGSCIPDPDSSGRDVVFAAEAPKPVGPYSQAIKTGNVLYVSGQIGLSKDGTLDSSSIENETSQALKNIRTILLAAGSSTEKVIKVTVYMKNLGDFPRMNEVYRSFFPDSPPARETVGVKDLPKGAHIEISVIAQAEP
jgi:2-iminobutanoate/2-iminopropanoate deaminase